MRHDGFHASPRPIYACFIPRKVPLVYEIPDRGAKSSPVNLTSAPMAILKFDQCAARHLRSCNFRSGALVMHGSKSGEVRYSLDRPIFSFGRECVIGGRHRCAEKNDASFRVTLNYSFLNVRSWRPQTSRQCVYPLTKRHPGRK